MEQPSDHREIREAVARLCERFPGPYWRELDRDNRYPTEFVAALTEAGYLSVLIPEEFGGSGLGLSAAAAILGMIPIMHDVGTMAYAIVGGLAVATALTLVFLPALYVTVNGIREPGKATGPADSIPLASLVPQH